MHDVRQLGYQEAIRLVEPTYQAAVINAYEAGWRDCRGYTFPDFMHRSDLSDKQKRTEL